MLAAPGRGDHRPGRGARRSGAAGSRVPQGRRASADAIITTGGVSVGEADFVKQLMAQLGEVLFWKIAMRPGRPMAFGRIGNAFLFGLPGNPVAVMVTFYQFVRDALLVLGGRTDGFEVPLLKAASAAAIRKVPGTDRVPARHLSTAKAATGKCAPPASRARACCARCRRRTASSCSSTSAGRSRPGEPVQVQLFEGLA